MKSYEDYQQKKVSTDDLKEVGDEKGEVACCYCDADLEKCSGEFRGGYYIMSTIGELFTFRNDL